MINIIRKYNIELAVFVTIILTMTSYVSLSIPHWNFLTFVIDYHTGFGGRKLIGTLTSTILGGYVQRKVVLLIILLFYVLLIGGLSLLIGAFIRKLKSYGNEHYIFSIYTAALYLFCPASLLFLVSSSNMGRMDGFIIASVFTFVPFYIKGRYSYIAAFLLSAISMLIHPIFACTYFPFYMALMIYDSFKSGVDKSKLFASLGICFVLFIFFCYIQLAPKETMSATDAFNYLSSRTDYPLNKSSLYYEYYAPFDKHLQDWAIPNYPHSLAGLVLTILFLSPIFIYFILFWRNCIKNAGSSLEKNTYRLMNAAFLVMIPAFIVTVDYARWMAGYIICQFMLIGILLYKGDKCALNSSMKISQTIKDYPVLAMLILLYISSFPKFTDMVYPGIIERIIGYLGIKYVSFF